MNKIRGFSVNLATESPMRAGGASVPPNFFHGVKFNRKGVIGITGEETWTTVHTSYRQERSADEPYIERLVTTALQDKDVEEAMDVLAYAEDAARITREFTKRMIEAILEIAE